MYDCNRTSHKSCPKEKDEKIHCIAIQPKTNHMLQKIMSTSTNEAVVDAESSSNILIPLQLHGNVQHGGVVAVQKLPNAAASVNRNEISHSEDLNKGVTDVGKCIPESFATSPQSLKSAISAFDDKNLSLEKTVAPSTTDTLTELPALTAITEKPPNVTVSTAPSPDGISTNNNDNNETPTTPISSSSINILRCRTSYTEAASVIAHAGPSIATTLTASNNTSPTAARKGSQKTRAIHPNKRESALVASVGQDLPSSATLAPLISNVNDSNEFQEAVAKFQKDLQSVPPTKESPPSPTALATLLAPKVKPFGVNSERNGLMYGRVLQSTSNTVLPLSADSTNTSSSTLVNSAVPSPPIPTRSPGKSIAMPPSTSNAIVAPLPALRLEPASILVSPPPRKASSQAFTVVDGDVASIVNAESGDSQVVITSPAASESSSTSVSVPPTILPITTVKSKSKQSLGSPISTTSNFSDAVTPTEPVKSPNLARVPSFQSSGASIPTFDSPQSLPSSPSLSVSRGSVEKQAEEKHAGDKTRTRDSTAVHRASEMSDIESMSGMESLMDDLAVSAVSDSDGTPSDPDNPKSATLPLSSVDEKAPSLRERMDLMRIQSRKATTDEGQFEGAKFLVENVQHVPKADQKSFCEAAVKALKRLAQQQMAEAQYLLATLYVSGVPGFENRHEPNYEKAVGLYASAAKQKHAEALFHLGLCCENGVGTRSSWARAVSYYRKAGSSNHPGAMFRIGMATLSGELGLNRNYRDGVKWLKLSAKYANSKYPQALYELALLHDQGVAHVIFPDHNYLIELLIKAAELGHAPSQFKLGEAYEYGHFGCQLDAGRSIYFYSLAAAQGHLEAMFELGGWHLTGASDCDTGYELPVSYIESMRWVSLAASHGLPRALFAMGYFYENGIGIGADMAQAWLWYEKAAQSGDPKAQQKLTERPTTAPLASLMPSESNRRRQSSFIASINMTTDNGSSTSMAELSHSGLELGRRNRQCVMF